MSTPAGEDLASPLDALRIAAGEIDARAAVAVESLDNADRMSSPAGEDLASLLEALRRRGRGRRARCRRGGILR
jgi:hypothetical protein